MILKNLICPDMEQISSNKSIMIWDNNHKIIIMGFYINKL